MLFGLWISEALLWYQCLGGDKIQSVQIQKEKVSMDEWLIRTQSKHQVLLSIVRKVLFFLTAISSYHHDGSQCVFYHNGVDVDYLIWVSFVQWSYCGSHVLDYMDHRWYLINNSKLHGRKIKTLWQKWRISHETKLSKDR